MCVSKLRIRTTSTGLNFRNEFCIFAVGCQKWNLIKLRFMHAVITGRLAIQWHAGRTVVLTCLQFTTCVYQCVFIPIIWFVDMVLPEVMPSQPLVAVCLFDLKIMDWILRFQIKNFLKVSSSYLPVWVKKEGVP